MPGPTLLATMFTTTTYGTWLPGDLRGYVDRGVILPGNSDRLDESHRRMRGDPIYLSEVDRDIALKAIVDAVREFEYQLLAISIESWHVHAIVAHGFDPPAKAIGRLKTRMRQAVNRGRIWTEGYDKRFCFDERTINQRRSYINRHPGAREVPIH